MRNCLKFVDKRQAHEENEFTLCGIRNRLRECFVDNLRKLDSPGGMRKEVTKYKGKELRMLN